MQGLLLVCPQINGIMKCEKKEAGYEKAYDIATVKKLLKQSGLELCAVYDAYTFEPPKPDSQRIYFVAREVQKTEECDVLQEELCNER